MGGSKLLTDTQVRKKNVYTRDIVQQKTNYIILLKINIKLKKKIFIYFYCCVHMMNVRPLIVTHSALVWSNSQNHWNTGTW